MFQFSIRSARCDGGLKWVPPGVVAGPSGVAGTCGNGKLSGLRFIFFGGSWGRSFGSIVPVYRLVGKVVEGGLEGACDADELDRARPFPFDVRREGAGSDSGTWVDCEG